MQCYSQQEIADACECTQPTVNEVLSKEFLETKSIKPAANHLADFDPPLYNVWKQEKQPAFLRPCQVWPGVRSLILGHKSPSGGGVRA